MTTKNMHKSYTQVFVSLQVLDFTQETTNVVIEWE